MGQTEESQRAAENVEPPDHGAGRYEEPREATDPEHRDAGQIGTETINEAQAELDDRERDRQAKARGGDKPSTSGGKSS